MGNETKKMAMGELAMKIFLKSVCYIYYTTYTSWGRGPKENDKFTYQEYKK